MKIKENLCLLEKYRGVDILKFLQGNILEDEIVIEILFFSKILLEEISEKQLVVIKIEVVIDDVRNGYKFVSLN